MRKIIVPIVPYRSPGNNAGWMRPNVRPPMMHGLDLMHKGGGIVDMTSWGASHLNGFRGLGSVNLAPGGQSVTPQQGVEKGAAAGASFGPWGAVIGAAVGLVVGLLSSKPNTAAHIGTWDSQLVSAFGALPPAAGVGRQFPWNDDSQGLVQMLEALLATGIYMNWDTSILSNYSVCANWAVTLSNAAQVVATAVCQNKKGAKVTVQITAAPGGPVGPGPFTFVNPGIMVGPEAVSDQVIMGASGVMTWLFSRWTIAGTAALSKQYASQMGNNAAAGKVYALMVDYVAGQLNVADQPVSTDVQSAVLAAATTVATAATSTIQNQYYWLNGSAHATTGVLPAGAVAMTPAQEATLEAGVQTDSTPAEKAAMATLVASLNAAAKNLSGVVAAPIVSAPPPVIIPACPTPVATTSTGSTVTDTDIASLISALQTSGANQAASVSAALTTLENQGVNTSSPAVQAAVAAAVPSAGLTTTEWILVAAAAVGIYLAVKK